MCGFLVCLGRGAPLPEEITAALAHRGPDDTGHAAEETPAGLLELRHTRLAIQDLSPAGAQPMRRGGATVVYNGEIYNAPELRTRLAAQGATFESSSDTEVLLEAYRAWGTHLLEELVGPYAFVLHDAEQQRLLLARDPLGEKPLYHTTPGKGPFLAASEVRALLASGEVPRRISPQGLRSYLAFGAVQGPDTLVEGVRCLPPGTAMEMDLEAGTHRIWKHWRLPRPDPEASVDHEALRETLAAAIGRSTLSDRPVAVFLSAGLDSGGIAGALAAGGRTPATFTVAFPEDWNPEGGLARKAAEALGTEHHEVTLTEDEILESTAAFLEAQDQPSMDGLNTFVVSRAARNAGWVVALSGVGGDELFGGYPSFARLGRSRRLARAAPLLPAGARRLLGAAARVAGGARIGPRAEALIRDAHDDVGAYLALRMLFTLDQAAELSPGVTAGPALAPALSAELAEHVQGLAPFEQAGILESRLYLANTLLRDVDVMGMAHGQEIRAPFLDRTLVEAVARLPGDARSGEPAKALLRELIAPWVPEDILAQPKRGFALPFDRWLRNGSGAELTSPLAADVTTVLAAAPAPMDPKACTALWRAFQSGDPAVSWSRPWGLYVLARYLERHRLVAA